MSWTSPFSLPGSWFKGNLHTHTTQSDGALTPDQAIAWYREQGYDFLAISDHWVLTKGQTFAPATDFITLSGAELHGIGGYHLLAVGLSELPPRKPELDLQQMVEAVLAQGGVPFVAHPYWTGQTSAEITNIQGIYGIEVFNAVCARTRGLGYSLVHWDDMLATGKRMWGLAVDDVHWKYNAQGMGFIMVKAPSLDQPSILNAIRQGNFYASTGPAISDLRLEVLPGGSEQPEGKLALRVHCSPCKAITFYARGPLGVRYEAPAGQYLYSAACPLRTEQIYLRVACEDENGGIAWSNPVFVEDVLD
ncbi:MAG: CehA/McbA family metallohydrolase [Chloroflexi bacterium]|jgi:hypothetical protein|nr:CehA/McbA family metallohydrolase [Chloroflexota bacterium]